MLGTDESERAGLNTRLTGPLVAQKTSQVDEKTGIRPPSWWRGDEEASRSSLAATLTLRRTR